MKILFFGPNGSGKGTQGAILRQRYDIPHVESCAIFRHHIAGNTELGREANEFMMRGDLVPDAITIPMILERLAEPDCANGWLLDGFPRNRAQAEALMASFEETGIGVDIVVEIVLDRDVAKKRIVGRRVCVNDNNHPNNALIEAIMPVNGSCRVCGGALSTRADDIDEAAVEKRQEIYYDEVHGTIASARFFESLAARGLLRYITLNGNNSVPEVSAELVTKL